MNTDKQARWEGGQGDIAWAQLGQFREWGYIQYVDGSGQGLCPSRKVLVTWLSPQTRSSIHTLADINIVYICSESPRSLHFTWAYNSQNALAGNNFVFKFLFSSFEVWEFGLYCIINTKILKMMRFCHKKSLYVSFNLHFVYFAP